MPANSLADASEAALTSRSRAAVLWDSTIGKKVVMGVTGLIMVGFVIGHVLGNLLVFAGAAKLNAYSAFLKSTGELLWIVRGVLLLSVILHVTAAYQLTMRKRAARPVDYARRDPQVSTWGARTIRWGGALILVFIVFHLLHFTTGTLHPAFDAKDVYGNVIAGFQVWYVSLFYLLAMSALGLHLYHGTWSSLRTMGLAQPSAHPLQRRVVTILAAAVWLGFSSIPLAVVLGFLK